MSTAEKQEACGAPAASAEEILAHRERHANHRDPKERLLAMGWLIEHDPEFPKPEPAKTAPPPPAPQGNP